MYVTYLTSIIKKSYNNIELKLSSVIPIQLGIMSPATPPALPGGGCPPDSLCGRLWPGGGVENHGWLPPVYSH